MVLFVRDNGSIAIGLVLTVWLTKITAKKQERKVCCVPCPLAECYAFRVVELQANQKDRPCEFKCSEVNVCTVRPMESLFAILDCADTSPMSEKSAW